MIPYTYNSHVTQSTRYTHIHEDTRSIFHLDKWKILNQCLFKAMAEMTMRRTKKTTEIEAATTAVLAVWQKSPNC